MPRCIILLVVVAAVLAKPIFNLKGQESMSLLDMGFEEHSAKQHNQEMANVRRNSEFFTYAAKTTVMERPEIDLSKLKPKAQARLKRAMATDQVMYGGGKSFQPGPGHEMFFDFEGFNAFAQAHTASMKHQLKKSRHNRETHHSNSTGGLTSKKFLTACFEINVCATDVASGGVTAGLGQTVSAAKPFDTCGQLGFSGTVELETTGGKQKLTLSAAVTLSVSFKAFGAALSVYAGGQADWEFEVLAKTPYTDVYTALFAAIKNMITKTGGSSTVPKAVLERSALARKMLADEKKEAKDTSPMPVDQTDELTGLVKIHYKILDDFKRDIATKTTAAQGQQALHLAIYKNIYVPTAPKLAAAKKKTTIDQMIDSKDFPCANLKSQGTDNMLFCSLLKYGVILPANQRKVTKGLLWNNDGSSENSKNSIPEFYKEVWPTTNDRVQFVKDQLDDWFEKWRRIQPSDWINFQNITEKINKPTNDGSLTEFTRRIPMASITDTTMLDPCTTARRLFQTLAMDSTAIQKTLDSKYTPSTSTFKFSKVTITGFVGATWGSGRMGFCTNDSNDVQFKFSNSFSWTPGDGWEVGDWDGQIWLAFSFSSFFQLQVTIPMKTLKFWTAGNSAGSADNAWSLRYHFSIPNGFIKGDPFSPTLTAVQAIGSALVGVLSHWYQTWKAVKTAKKAALMSTFKTAVFSIMDKKNYDPVKTACVSAGAIKAPDETYGGTLGTIAKATAAAAMTTALTTVLSAIGLKFGSLTEVGLQASFYKEGNAWKYAPSIDIGTAYFVKVDLGAFVFYVIQGDSYEAVAPAVTI